jgi:glutamate-1-semialdehyde aminotransferase/spore coat polysaccharide biosynthesis protein SpsF (cytidylyltransferase family)
MKTIAIVQARLGSRRLPDKMLVDLAGAPALERTLRRMRRAALVDEWVLATTTRPEDRALMDLASKLGIAGFAGDEDDVLDRFYHAARAHWADVVVRLTGDCPLHDPAVIDCVIQAYRDADDAVDYVSNAAPPTYPDGLDVEVFSFALLERMWSDAAQPADREHVTTFVRSRLDQFRTFNVRHEGTDLSGLRWTLDEPADLEFLRWVFGMFGGRDDFDWRDVLALLRDHPDRGGVNAHIARNMGWISAVMQDRMAPPLKIVRSNELWERAKQLIPAGTQTLSKGPTQFVDGVAPKYLARGKGSHVWDVDGNEYIDFPMGLGPVTLGHCHPVTQEAVRRQLEEGITFSMMHPLELEVAERLCEIIPCAERVRFGKNGSDATAAAVRCARALTGRDLIAHCGYHGWQDWYIGSVGGVRARGVPESVKALQKPFIYNDVGSLERIFAEHPGQVAGVIMEVMTVQEPRDGFLQKVADLARRNGAVLVFDEIISGCRYRLGGLQEYFGVTPDLATVGKGMANGLPISAVVGRAEVMSTFDDIFFSFTFGGECLSLAAAKACIDFIRREPVIEHFWKQGEKLQTAYRQIAQQFGLEAYTDCAGLPPWTACLFLDHEGQQGLAMKSLFQQELLKRGILFSGSQFICYEHSDADVQRTIDAYEAAFTVLRHGVQNNCVERLLEGKKIEPVFRRV